MEVRFSQREIDWLNDYCGHTGMSIEGVARHAVRLLSLVVATPGGLEAMRLIAEKAIVPKWGPMPPIPEPSNAGDASPEQSATKPSPKEG